MEVSTSEETTDRKLLAKDYHYHVQKKSTKKDKEESVSGRNGRTLMMIDLPGLMMLSWIACTADVSMLFRVDATLQLQRCFSTMAFFAAFNGIKLFC